MFWVIVGITLLHILLYKVLKFYNYWQEKGIPSERTWPVLGQFAPIVFRIASLPDVFMNIYERIGDVRYFGIYQFLTPTLFIKDPDLIKELTIKNFDHFVDHRSVISEETDPITSKTLLALKGQEWHNMRTTLSPAFTSSKMKFMFSLISNCTDKLMDHLSSETSENLESLDIKDLFTRFANDVIASCAFGLECDSLKHKDNVFYQMVQDTSDLSGLKGLKLFGYSLSPKLMSILKVQIFDDEVYEYFRMIVGHTVKYREENNIVRTDMIHLLMEARKGTLKHDDNDHVEAESINTKQTYLGNPSKYRKELTMDDIVSQALVFVFAGFESNSSLMCFIAYELALNPDVQRILQQEIDDTQSSCDGIVTYEALSKMKYLDMVISETLRKWPPFVFTDRICVKDYTVEAKYPNEKSVTISKDDLIMLPIQAIQMDPKSFHDPNKFDPERFSDENRKNVVPGTYMPFGIGPRNCIGSRFALMETKAVFFSLLSKFDILVTKKTQIPLKSSKKHVTLVPERGIWLGLKLRS